VLKRYEEMKKDESGGDGTSPNPTLQQVQQQSDQVRNLLTGWPDLLKSRESF
jgi:hypothetical protein